MKKYIICHLQYNLYYSDIIINEGDFTEYLNTAKCFDSKKSAKEKTQELPKGIYEIKTIYVNE